MILLTVGHQMPFDRLVRIVDEWAGRTRRTDLFAQIGADATYQPRNFKAVATLSPQEFRENMARATAVVAHAGTGTIIAAAQARKPLLVFPRLSRLGETRNDHQVPTAQRFAEAGYVQAAYDEAELIARLDTIERFTPRALNGACASERLLACVRGFVAG